MAKRVKNVGAVRSPVETQTQLPADTAPTPSNADGELDDLLREFDEKTRQSEPKPATDNVGTQPDGNQSDLNQQLQDLLGPDPKVTELQGQLNDMRVQLHRESEIRAYHDYADDLERHVQEANPNVPEGWTKLMMDSYAHNPEIALAWDTRNINPQDAARDLNQVLITLNQLKANPNADPKQIQELSQLAYKLDIAARSPAILRQCRNQIISESKKLKPPIDEIATADRDAVAFAVRENITGTIPEPPVNWGRLSNQEFRERVKRDYGYDPAV